MAVPFSLQLRFISKLSSHYLADTILACTLEIQALLQRWYIYSAVLLTSSQSSATSRLTSSASIRAFCNKYHKSELRSYFYAPIGNIFSHKSPDLEKQRQTASCTLLLSLLLTAPVERDIRLITIFNPSYATAACVFTASPPSKSSSLLTEGRRAFRTAIFMRHLQRVIDALPSDSQVPPTDVNTYLPLECTHSCLTLSCRRQASVMRISVSSAVLSSVHCTDCLSLVHKKRFSCPSRVGIDFKRRADLDI